MRRIVVLSVLCLALAAALLVPAGASAAAASSAVPSVQYYDWYYVSCGSANDCPGYIWTGSAWRSASVEAYRLGRLWTYGETVYTYPSPYGSQWTWAYSREARNWILLYRVQTLDPRQAAMA